MTLCAALQSGVELRITELDAGGAAGGAFKGLDNPVNAASHFVTLLHKQLLNSWRDIGVFWLRLGMYVGLCVALGTIYFDLGKSWDEASSRGGLIFFTLSFLTFMSISGFPVFVDDMKVRPPAPVAIILADPCVDSWCMFVGGRWRP